MYPSFPLMITASVTAREGCPKRRWTSCHRWAASRAFTFVKKLRVRLLSISFSLIYDPSRLLVCSFSKSNTASSKSLAVLRKASSFSRCLACTKEATWASSPLRTFRSKLLHFPSTKYKTSRSDMGFLRACLSSLITAVCLPGHQQCQIYWKSLQVLSLRTCVASPYHTDTHHFSSTSLPTSLPLSTLTHLTSIQKPDPTNFHTPPEPIFHTQPDQPHFYSKP